MLMAAICAYARRTRSRRVPSNAVAPSIDIDPPVVPFSEAGTAFREVAMVLKDAGLITGKPVNFEFVVLTDKGFRACEEVM